MSLLLGMCFLLLNVCLLANGQCVNTTNQSSGTITSPLYPNGYGDNKNCEWTITSQYPTNVVIKIDVTDILMHTTIFGIKSCTGQLTIDEGEASCISGTFCNFYYDATSSNCNKTTLYDDTNCRKIPFTNQPFVVRFTSVAYWSIFFPPQRFRLGYEVMNCIDDTTTTMSMSTTTETTTTTESQKVTSTIDATTIRATTKQQTDTTIYDSTNQFKPVQQTGSHTLAIALPLILIALALIILAAIIILRRRRRDRISIHLLQDMNTNTGDEGKDNFAYDHSGHVTSKLILQSETGGAGVYSGGVADEKSAVSSDKMADGDKTETPLHGISADGNEDVRENGTNAEKSLADGKREDEYAKVDKSRKNQGSNEKGKADENERDSKSDLGNEATGREAPDGPVGDITDPNVADGKGKVSSDEPSAVYATVKKS